MEELYLRGGDTLVSSCSIRNVKSRALFLRSRNLKRHIESERGFTLIEMLVVLIILPLIVGAISLAIVAIFTQESNVTGRLSGSTDLQMIDATYVRDVESAWTFTNLPTKQVCGTVGTQLLGMTWSGDQTAVSYVIVPGNGSGSAGYNAQLRRLYCTSGSTIPTSVMVVSNGVSTGSQSQQPPTICTGNVSTSGNCPTPLTFPVLASDVTEVRFDVYVPGSHSPYVMVASPRQGALGNLTGGPITTTPIVLTSTACGTVLSVENGGQLWINVGNNKGNGALTVESPCAGAAAVSSGNSGGQSTLCVSAIISGSRPLGTWSNPTNPNPCGTNSPSQPPWYYSTKFTDPLTNLPVPGSQTLLGQCSVSGNNSNQTYDCSPGLYTSQATGVTVSGQLPVFTNHSNIQFASGDYEFTMDVLFPIGATIDFGSGTYSFTATGEAFKVPSAKNFAHSNNIDPSTVTNITGTNVLLYAPNGSMSFGNNNTVNVTPPTDPQYYGVTIWDGPPLSNCPLPPNPLPANYTYQYVVKLANNGNDTYGGIYAPCAQIQTKANGSLYTSFIVASAASFSTGTIINVTTP